jgi:peptidoglycan/LPS O-acetylase OafA/YrhL
LSHGTVQTGQHYALTLATNLLGVSGILYGWQGTMNQTAWSIGVEVFCYILVFPFLAHWSKKTSLSLWSLLALAAFLDFLMGTCYAQATFYAPARGWNSLWLVRGIFGFTAGFLTCGAFRRAAGLKISTSWINLTLLAAGVIFVLSRLGVLPDYAMIYLFPPVVFLTAYDRGVVAWLMERPVFQWLGERSYSIYLWQYPAAGFYLLVFNRIILREPTYTPHQGGFGVLSFTMAVAFVLGIAELSYRYFETPCREKIRRWGQVKKSGPEEWKLPPTHAADLRSEPQLP